MTVIPAPPRSSCEAPSINRGPGAIGLHSNMSFAELISKFEVLGARTTKNPSITSIPSSESTVQSISVTAMSSDDAQGANRSLPQGETSNGSSSSSSSAVRGRHSPFLRRTNYLPPSAMTVSDISRNSSTRQNTNWPNYLPPSSMTVTDISRTSSIRRDTMTPILPPPPPRHQSQEDKSGSSNSSDVNQGQKEPVRRQTTHITPPEMTVSDVSQNPTMRGTYLCSKHQTLAERRKIFEAPNTDSSELM